jgi:hypothetical protein
LRKRSSEDGRIAFSAAGTFPLAFRHFSHRPSLLNRAENMRESYRKMLDENHVHILRIVCGKPVDSRPKSCAKQCGFPVGKRRINGGNQACKRSCAIDDKLLNQE